MAVSIRHCQLEEHEANRFHLKNEIADRWLVYCPPISLESYDFSSARPAMTCPSGFFVVYFVIAYSFSCSLMH